LINQLATQLNRDGSSDFIRDSPSSRPPIQVSGNESISEIEGGKPNQKGIGVSVDFHQLATGKWSLEEFIKCAKRSYSVRRTCAMQWGEQSSEIRSNFLVLISFKAIDKKWIVDQM
jgi:hypothetical protein